MTNEIFLFEFNRIDTCSSRFGQGRLSRDTISISGVPGGISFLWVRYVNCHMARGDASG